MIWIAGDSMTSAFYRCSMIELSIKRGWSGRQRSLFDSQGFTPGNNNGTKLNFNIDDRFNFNNDKKNNVFSF